MQFKICNDSEELIAESAAFIADVCRSAENDCYIGLAGGKTPKPVYQLFGQEDIDPTRIHLFLTDERYVPHDNAESNYHMIETSLLKQHEGQWGSVHAFDTERSIDDALSQYEVEVQAIPEGSFDLLVLGVGPDGHIASLFPGFVVLDTPAHIVHTTTDVHSVHDRLTITAPVIMNAKKVLVLLSGQEKKAVFDELSSQTRNVSEFPAHILQTHRDATLYYST